jgi:mitochondrial cardiolipin hydrolase
MNLRSALERLGLTLVFCVIIGIFFFAAYKINEWQSPAYRATRELVDHGSIKRALFAPDDDIQDLLLTLIDEEKEQILITAYSLTDSDIAHAIIRAYKRGVALEVLVDGSNAITAHSKVSLLMKSHIPVWIYPSVKKDDKPVGIMHNKFMVFKRSLLGRSIVWTGSFNFTRSAQSRNQENVIVTDDQQLVERYRKHFEKIKKRCIRAW